ncbi:hypothetical protein GGF31_001092 [Allomyces arbusculus]|nr:hypothetical protein GGF31_001092 [Allomyces arbusculus]
MSIIDETTTEELKAFIQRQLEPICEADSGVLSDYIIALLRHDMEFDDLKTFCIEQLSDFLASSTQQFVDVLFGALRTKSYLPRPPAPAAFQAPAPAPVAPSALAPAPAPPRRAPTPPPAAAAPAPPAQQAVPIDDRLRSPGRARHPVHPHDGGFPPQHAAPAPVPAHGGFPASDGGFPRSDPPAPAGFPHGASPPPHMPPGAVMPPPVRDRDRPFGPIPSGLGDGMPPRQKRRGRCRDFDEKGVCMRGDSCIFQHIGPIVEGELPLPGRFAPHPSHMPPMRNDRFGPRPPNMMGGGYPAPGPFGAPAPGIPPGGGAPGMRMGMGFRMNNGGGAPGGGRASGNFIPGRSRDPQPAIVVDQIPTEHCNAAQINEFFARFGRIENLQVFEQERRAIITFATVDEAKAAHGSPDPIFGNRFIKVFFYNPDRHDATGAVSKPAHHQHHQHQQHGHHHAPPPGAYPPPPGYPPMGYPYPGYPPMGYPPYPGAPHAPAAPGTHAHDDVKLAEVYKKKDENLQKLQAMQRALEAKLATVGEAQRGDVETMITSLAKQIKEAKTSLLNDPRAASFLPKLVQKLAEERRRDQLDRELDLISQQAHEARDGPSPANGDGPASDDMAVDVTISPAVRSALDKPLPSGPVNWSSVRSKYSLDLRPTTLLVAGAESDEVKAAAIQQFREWGDVEALDESAEATGGQERAFVIKYKSRPQAEKAYAYGASPLPGIGQLKVSWKQ